MSLRCRLIDVDRASNATWQKDYFVGEDHLSSMEKGKNGGCRKRWRQEGKGKKEREREERMNITHKE